MHGSDASQDPTERDLDTAVLAHLSGPDLLDSEEVVREVIAVFVADVPLRIRNIRTAMVAGDLEAIARTSHNLKGACAHIGARRLQSAAHRLCITARSGGAREIPWLYQELQKAWERVLPLLQTRCQA